MTPTTAHLLYLVFAAGGAGVYLLLPKVERAPARAGAVIGLLSVVGFFIVLAVRVVSPDGASGLFYLFGAIAVVAAARVVTHPKPVYCALYFVLVVVATAALLVLMSAEFLAVALIIIYAGAILVTYLFVIMLAQQEGSPLYDRRSREPFLSVLAGFVLMAAVAGRGPAMVQAIETPGPPSGSVMQSSSSPAAPVGNTLAIGSAVMTRYIVALELAGLLLLISMVGAIAMSRKPVPAEGAAVSRRPLGAVGREVEPF